MGSSEAGDAIEKFKALSALDDRPALTPYWETRSANEQLHHFPPSYFVFAYRSNSESFESFANWFEWDTVFKTVHAKPATEIFSQVRTFTAAALDQGIIKLESSNGYVQQFLAAAVDTGVQRSFVTSLQGTKVQVDPAKSLFLFMLQLWFDLQFHQLHPGFDIRSYMSQVLGTVIEPASHTRNKGPT